MPSIVPVLYKTITLNLYIIVKMTCSIQKLNSGLLFQLQSPRQASNKTHESELRLPSKISHKQSHAINRDASLTKRFLSTLTRFQVTIAASSGERSLWLMKAMPHFLREGISSPESIGPDPQVLTYPTNSLSQNLS